MLHRRSLLMLGASSILIKGTAMPTDAEPSIMSTAGNAQPPMTPTEQLMYSTVRLHYTEAGRTSWGTGFVYYFFKSGEAAVPAIVTNRHVIAGMKTCSFSLASLNNDGTPNPSSHIPVTIQNFEKLWIAHPSVDLAIFPLAGVLNELNAASKRPFIVHGECPGRC